MERGALGRVAVARALLAVDAGLSGCYLVGGSGRPSVGAGGALWLVSGLRTLVVAQTIDARPFAQAVRATGGRLSPLQGGKVVAYHHETVCALCGLHAPGGLDAWVVGHALVVPAAGGIQ